MSGSHRHSEELGFHLSETGAMGAVSKARRNLLLQKSVWLPDGENAVVAPGNGR